LPPLFLPPPSGTTSLVPSICSPSAVPSDRARHLPPCGLVSFAEAKVTRNRGKWISLRFGDYTTKWFRVTRTARSMTPKGLSSLATQCFNKLLVLRPRAAVLYHPSSCEDPCSLIILISMATRVPYLQGVKVVPERMPAKLDFPFNLPFVAELDLRIQRPVTFFVGENGTGKSTLIEAVAALCL